MENRRVEQALDKYGFDVAFGGAHRDEDKSRAKERVYFPNSTTQMGAKAQRPELWSLYITRKNKGESMVFFR